jgi:DNA polymerase elongation subunit (family B)
VEKLAGKRKYEAISSGDKIRHFYVRQPNKYGLKMIGYKYDYPTEFTGIFEPDYELIFEKEVYAVIERFYDAVGWKLKKPSEQVQTDLFDLLGMDS